MEQCKCNQINLIDMERTREKLEHDLFVVSVQRERLQDQVADLRRRMMAEREAKEQAYAFILESGLYEQFREYSRLKLYGDDAHKTCVEYLTHVSGVSMFDFKKPKT